MGFMRAPTAARISFALAWRGLLTQLERRVEELLRLAAGVGRVQQHRAVYAVAALHDGDEAVSRAIRRAGLQPDRAGVLQAQERIRAVQPEVAALDRETDLHVRLAHEAGDAPLGHRHARERSQVRRTGAVRVLEPVC